jgi:queuine/archaeosine tRNA-ribosyltransferase
MEAGRELPDANTTGKPRARVLRTRRGLEVELPLFLPVFRPGTTVVGPGAWEGSPLIRGCMANAFFLYKDRTMRRRFAEGLTLAEHLAPRGGGAFDGLLCTDSGAFQGFRGKLFLANRKIVAFQDAIGADVAAPLDLVTPPGDKRSVAERKLAKTQKRIREGLGIAEHCLLAGIQQGGRFMDLRRRAVDELVEMGVEYLGLGSLVPFFNKNHDLAFVGAVIRDARAAAGPDLPMHVYGAGDPCELPFMAAMGADIFDSSSYAHFANAGWYMTRFGALSRPDRVAAGEYACACPACAETSPRDIFASRDALTLHNLWTICDTVDRMRVCVLAGSLDAMLDEVLAVHTEWFPGSALASSWEALRSEDG